MIVTIDGPAGAGKSSISRLLAQRLGFRFLDTGAMYRAVALAALRSGVDFADESQVAAVAQRIRIEMPDDRVLIDGVDVTDEIRSSEVTLLVHYAADNRQVRRRLIELQRQIAGSENFVCEGRDQGTEAFPAARCKIFLTASPEERARRRLQDLAAQGEDVTFDELLAQQNERDQRDQSREVGKLVRAADAVEVVSDGMTMEQVVDRLEAIVREKMPAA